MNAKLKKILNIAQKVITLVLVIFTVFMMIFTVVTAATFNKNERPIFGYRFYIVSTDSMSLSENNKDMDVHFNAGDIIIAKIVDDPTQFQEGEIITFISTNSDNYGKVITHMIRKVEKRDDGSVIGYVTYGTNTGASDEALVEPEFVLGVYVNKMPIVGRFFAFVKSTPGYITCILVPFLLLILYNGVNVIRLFRKYKGEQMEEMNAEREKIEAERAEAQRMMQELMALKAQLDQQNNGGEVTPQAAPPASEETSTEDNTSAETTDEQ